MGVRLDIRGAVPGVAVFSLQRRVLINEKPRLLHEAKPRGAGFRTPYQGKRIVYCFACSRPRRKQLISVFRIIFRLCFFSRYLAGRPSLPGSKAKRRRMGRDVVDSLKWAAAPHPPFRCCSEGAVALLFFGWTIDRKPAATASGGCSSSSNVRAASRGAVVVDADRSRSPEG